jgi:iron complex transport system substrate-binding protein
VKGLALIFALLALAAPAGAQGLVDDSGRAISFERPFQRVVSLYAAHTENLFALGAGSRVVAVSTHETHPPEALERPALSYRDDPERILAFKPDLVLIRPMILRGHRGVVDSLRAAGVAVVSLQPRGSAELFAYWRRLGLLVGREKEAREMIEGFREQVGALRARVGGVPAESRPRVYFEAIHRRMKTFAPSSNAMYVLEAAGGVNLAAGASPVRGTNIAAYGKERILSHAQDMDVYLAQVGAMNQVGLSDIYQEPGFGALKAVRQERVHLVPEELVSRPTLRLLEGMRLIQGLLYPETGPAVRAREEKP